MRQGYDSSVHGMHPTATSKQLTVFRAAEDDNHLTYIVLHQLHLPI